MAGSSRARSNSCVIASPNLIPGICKIILAIRNVRLRYYLRNLVAASWAVVFYDLFPTVCCMIGVLNCLVPPKKYNSEN